MANYREEAPQIVKDFLRYLKKNKDLSDKTIDEYFLDLRVFFRYMKQERAAVSPDLSFEEIDISDIDLAFVSGIGKLDINNYVDYLRSDRVVKEGKGKESLGLSATATNRKIACLKSFFSYLCESINVLDKDPTLGVITPRVRKTLPKYLTEDESIRLLNAVAGPHAERDYCILLLFLTCGLRVSEMVGINIQDLRLETEDDYFLNIIGKGKKERQVYLSEACVEAIQDYLEVRVAKYAPAEACEDALFISRKHNRMSVDAVQNMVKKVTKAAGLREYSPHKMRHTAATMMLQNGVDVRTLQEVLGHQSIATTQIYTHVNSEAMRTATKANPMSRIKKRAK